MTSPMRGFTLVEVMTSLGLGLILTVLATGTFFQVRSILRRTQARLEMHNTARYFYQALYADIMSMQQDGALYVETAADANPQLPLGDHGHTGELRLTFLKAKTDNNSYDPHNDNILLATDLLWTQWRWQQNISAICTGANSTNRFWQESGHWVKDGKDYANANGTGKYFLNLPQPRRAAGSDAKSTLNDNRFNSGDAQDIGDYDDLVNNVHPVSRGITNFVLEVVLADGTVIDPTIASSSVYACDGSYVDGHVPVANAPHLKRPRLFRIRFDVTDIPSHFTQSFSFSFPAPGSAPSL